MRRVAVAAVSARALAEQAAREGFEVVALDLFGDSDTRRAVARWLPIGEPDTLRIDGARLLDALDELARSGAAQAWLVGSGFDGHADLLAEGAQRLPLIGNDAGLVRRVRDPRAFFDTLAAHGIAHPDVLYAAPADLRGWLVKDSAGCGGMQVRRATVPVMLGPSQYLQREAQGTPMSATFIADGHDAVVLGCNEQIVHEQGSTPFMYGGVIGPVPLGQALQRQLDDALRVLVPAFGLRGLGSLDFLRHGDRLSVLEVNPRPSASTALYADRAPLKAHLAACLDAVLPPRDDATSATLRGNQIVFARRAVTLDERACDWLAAQPDTHDLPSPAAFDRGAPLCSIDAEAGSAAALHELLHRRRDALLASLESSR